MYLQNFKFIYPYHEQVICNLNLTNYRISGNTVSGGTSQFLFLLLLYMWLSFLLRMTLHLLTVLQLTRLKCGGFVAGLHICHSIADGFGMIQLMMTVAELACGAEAPKHSPRLAKGDSKYNTQPSLHHTPEPFLPTITK